MEDLKTYGKENLKLMLLSQLEAKQEVLKKELDSIDKQLYYVEQWHKRLLDRREEVSDDLHEAEDIIQEFKEMEGDN